jgi:hypothetical protein
LQEGWKACPNCGTITQITQQKLPVRAPPEIREKLPRETEDLRNVMHFLIGLMIPLVLLAPLFLITAWGVQVDPSPWTCFTLLIVIGGIIYGFVKSKYLSIGIITGFLLPFFILFFAASLQ